MPLSGIALKAKRNSFYKRVKEKYNTSDEEIVRVLINAGHERYFFEAEEQYEVILNAYFKEKGRSEEKAKVIKKRIAETADKAGEWRKVVAPELPKYPCPIIGCTGKKNFNQGNSRDWVCTAGGRTHYNAMKLATIWRYLHPDGISIKEKATELVKSLKENNRVEEEKEGQVS